MDPNATLLRLRELIAWKQSTEDRGLVISPQTMAEYAHDVTELFTALDGWLGYGGFLPGSWQQAYVA